MAKITDEEILNLIATASRLSKQRLAAKTARSWPGPTAWLPVSTECSRRKRSPARTWPPVQPIS